MKWGRCGLGRDARRQTAAIASAIASARICNTAGRPSPQMHAARWVCKGSLGILLCLVCVRAAVWAAKPELVIDPGGVPPVALQAIVSAVDAIARLAEDQDGGEVSRLRRRAHEATLAALETQGYFSARVTLDAVTDALGEAWDIVIEPGARTQVESVRIAFSGSIAQAPYAQRVETLRAQWPLTSGMPFVNSAWSDAKTQLLEQVRQRDFYFARFAHTQARVDADAARAALDVAVDSGPRVVLGPLRIEGLRRVPDALITRYVRYAPGDAYDQEQLDEWQQALQSTSFFRGAFVTVDAQQDIGEDKRDDAVMTLPLHVRVSEAPAQSAAASLGVDSDNGVRAEGVFRQNIVFGQPVWIETGAGLDKREQRAFWDWHLAPDPRGHNDSFGLLLRRMDSNGLDTTRYGAGWKRRQVRRALGENRVVFETQWDVIAVQESQKIDGAPQDDAHMPTAIATWQWLRRDVDNPYDPREGHLIGAGAGAGVNLDRTEFFYRANLRAQQWWPVGRRHGWTLRAELGKTWAATVRVPTDFGYRLGGSRSVRGYRFQSLGLRRGSAVVGAPAMALVSLEYDHYFDEMWGMAVFVDAGDAAAAFSRMRWALGYGVGARVRTPAGPFQVDVAYGQRDRRLRLHMSLGIAF